MASPAEELFASLVLFGRTMRGHARNRSQLAGDTGLRRDDVQALDLIADCGPCRASALVELAGVGPSVISRQIAALEADGLISRTADPSDGRAELLELTPRGERQLELARSAYVEGLAQRLAGWDEAKVHQAAQVIREIAELMRTDRP